MKISDFKVGEKAYTLRAKGIIYRELIEEVNVLKVGRKYVTVKEFFHGGWEERYKKTENPFDNYLVQCECPTLMLFESMEDIEQYKKMKEKEHEKS